ncbi:VCBS domain-containing protein [Pseudomonas borbori]|uniref:VCBS domain-containing protein n=1 Tax=Pseudomonas borbori TaxID=289003 RepID=UPI00244ED3F5|nr:VCBS domain-containing protein [Pseudomonas borbori]
MIIEIVDDVPNAVDDSHSIAEDTLAPISGNVLSNDLHANGQPGADAPTSFVCWGSTAAGFGSFSDTGNGTYSYLLDNSNPAVQALDEGESLSETFSYTMQDADGDLDTATLTITITGSDDGPQLNVDPGNQGGNDQVFEAGLASGSAAGGSGVFATGTFTLSDADGLDDLVSVTIGTTTVAIANLAGSTFAGTNGTLTVTAYNAATGVASYSYELTSPTSDGLGVETDSFSLSVSDGTTSSAPASIIIEIVDDVPSAVDDSNLMFASENQLTLLGNVLNNDVQGADRLPGGPIQPGVLQGTYGTLTLSADGSYSYQLSPSDPDFLALGGGGMATETFTYTLNDADGDNDTANLVLQVRNLDDKVQIKYLDVRGGEQSVDEDDLLAGSDPSKEFTTVSGTFKVQAPDGLLNLTVGGINVVVNGVVNGFPQSITTPQGNILTITDFDVDSDILDEGIVSYSYTLSGSAMHSPGAGENQLTEHFAVLAEDVDHDTDLASLDINIVDDVPNAVDDSHSIAEDTVMPISGNVLSNDLHANGQPGADVPTSFVGWASTAASYGTFSDTGNGTYSYLLDNSNPTVQALDSGQSLTETFSYTMQDADGDLDTATLTITILGADDSAQVVTAALQGPDETVYEKGLTSAADTSETTGGTFTVSATDSIASVTVGGVSLSLAQLQTLAANNQVINTGEGLLTLTNYSGSASAGTLSYSYTLSAAIDNDSHSGATGTHFDDSVTVSVLGVGGSTASDELVIRIVDDTPTAVSDGPVGVTEDGASFVSGNVLTNDSAGADAPKEFTAWSAEGQDNSAALTALGSYGVLTLGSDGVYSFTLDNSQAAVQALTSGSNLSYDLYYTMRDADGDPSSAKLTITITGADDNASVVTAAAAGPDATVYEHGLTSVGDTSETVTGSFTVTASDGIASVSVGGSTFSLAQLLALSTANQVVNTGEGNLTLTGYNAATGVVSYSYTLSATIDNDSHTDATGSHFDDSVTVSVLGVGGSTASDELVIRIVDDTPTAVNDGPVGVTEDGASFVSGNVLTNDSAGADAPKEFTAWSAEGQDNSAALTALGSYGVLTLGSDGVYSFTLDNSQAAVQALTSGSNLSYDLYYTMRDADGDPSSAKLTITITGADDNASVVTAAAEGPDATVYEHGLTSAGDTSETVTGSFTVTASDGIASVTVGGSTFSLAQLQALSTANQVVNTGEGNLTLTGYNAATGVVSYSYTLSATIDNDSHSGATGTHFDDSVTVSVLGVGGSTASDELVIRIVDDTPTLTTVSPASLTNGPSGYATGSSDPVIGADVPGSADLTGNIAGWNGTSVTYAASSLTSGGNTVYYSVNPDDMGVLYAFTSATPAPYSGGAGQSLIFTLTYDVAGNYVIDMNGKLDGPAQTFGAIFNQNIGGNQDYLLVTDTGMLYKPSDSIPAGQTVIMSVDSSVGTVNSSQQGLAADSQWISGGLVLYFSYASPVVSAQFSIDIQSSDTTNAVNWTVYGQDALGNSVTESGTTVFTEGVLTDIPTTLTGITRIDLSDTGGSGFRVSGSSIVDRIEEDPISTSFDIGVIDADGDPASATLDVVFQPQFAGQFVVGSNANDVAGSAALYVTPAGAGGITGKGGNDILVGDEGRSDLVGKNVNMILALDSSDSMTTNISFNGTTMSRMAALKLAVNGLLSGLAVSAADNVRIQLVDFNNSAQSLGVFDIKGGELIAAQNAVNGLSANGWTNYEAGLQVALNWVASVGADAPYTGANVINQVVFVSDGAPNSWLSGNSTNLNNTVTNGATSTAVAHVLGTHNSDAISEVALLEAAFGQIQAVGINVGGSALDILNQIEGELSSVNPDVASNITTGEQLASVLADFNPETQLYDAGNDSILGGAGDDLIFGDVLYTDVLAAAAGLSTNPGAGWQVFAALESGVGTGAYATWTRADTVDYVLTHADELGQESGRALGHDSIDAGAGNDLVYGQEGNDIISGGSGDDVLFGGSGNDTLLGGDGDDLLIGGLGADVMTGGAGQDSYIWQPENLGDGVDHITGFFIDTSGIGSDVLDLSQLLTGVDTSVGSLQSYLDFAFAGTTTTVSVNVDASGPVEQQLVLDNINLSIFYGTANEASIITNLLDDSALKVDTV